MSPLAAQTYRINQDAARIRNIRLEMEAEFPVMYDTCTCDRDPLGVCPYPDHSEPRLGNLTASDELYNAVLADCLRDCEESNGNPSPGLMELERAIYNAKFFGGVA